MRKIDTNDKYGKKEWEDKQREAYLKRKYGLSIKEYDAMLIGQGGVCKICREAMPDGQRFHVDHDHITGRVRGLLCTACNHGLGNFKDNPMLLIEAYKYLGYH